MPSHVHLYNSSFILFYTLLLPAFGYLIDRLVVVSFCPRHIAFCSFIQYLCSLFHPKIINCILRSFPVYCSLSVKAGHVWDTPTDMVHNYSLIFIAVLCSSRSHLFSHPPSAIFLIFICIFCEGMIWISFLPNHYGPGLQH